MKLSEADYSSLVRLNFRFCSGIIFCVSFAISAFSRSIKNEALQNSVNSFQHGGSTSRDSVLEKCLTKNMRNMNGPKPSSLGKRRVDCPMT